jgi:hypothetical protein
LLNSLDPLPRAMDGTPFRAKYLARCGISRRTNLAENERDLVTFNQLADLLHRFRRAVCVVVGEIVDLATIYSGTVIDRLNVGQNSFADEANR